MAHRITEGYARLASGNVAVIGRGGIVTDIIPADEYDNPPGEWEGPTCSICDAIGHGYPGAAPCPLEDRGSYGPDDFGPF